MPASHRDADTGCTANRTWLQLDGHWHQRAEGCTHHIRIITSTDARSTVLYSQLRPHPGQVREEGAGAARPNTSRETATPRLQAPPDTHRSCSPLPGAGQAGPVGDFTTTGSAVVGESVDVCACRLELNWCVGECVCIWGASSRTLYPWAQRL